MEKKIVNINNIWANYTVDVLQKLCVKYACISPGNRNSPLISAFTLHPKIKCTSHIDERSAGYFALGLAKYSKSPVVLICTSGTAPANYYPAVIEANLSKIPLIILSADRPSKLRGTGANQTINQKDLFGYQVRMFKDVGLPEIDFGNLAQSLTKAVCLSLGQNIDGKIINPSGPVHLNFPFQIATSGEKGVESSNLITNYKLRITNSDRTKSNKANIKPIPQHTKPLIVCGRMDDTSVRIPILKFASAIGAPIFADPSSQIRYGMESPNIVTGYDTFLKCVDVEPDLIIRFGAKPTSKTLCNLLDNYNFKTMLVDQTGRFNDDCQTIIQSNIIDFCEFQIKHFDDKPINTEWLKKIQTIEISTQMALFSEQSFNKLFEGSIARTCISSLPSNSNFFIGNSMPIRNVDSFTPNSGKIIRVFVNRGASGIDGIVSSALGVASESNTNNNLLLIGDLSFYHDMNGLLTAKRYEIDLTIVVVNNNGGGIFSFLPISENKEKHFKSFWTTPHNLDFEKIAEVYGCQYSKIKSITELYDAITNSFEMQGLKIIEVPIDTEENVKCHREILEKLSRKLSQIN
ncbi:MAG: 2-succinyl-5-enolpyruvyl-6-hydroxy-3-cyclohexene-1-carboxylic-acid synthase [Candidatus Marinimicrobia bacterium]|nr:2-succinyl-5-enolpyruvyl-6-hydroxy-3-cyclohexene-1-carboxylic-acid synthase [Candidatus Neomarinimicrobiota bacterium]MBL7023537.1 2-succinyl-5-enolpyruvyl-6-hydroxy-3-cyclohexene-1-carboxylic-acid synthase [Candidatus Neomarinimicrobiota bacterium]MBL7109561.1 2-succinyl-5-enolpyruvyl-6-hydroxy-3-cyclohexene-1-carboxylic-acid synthase [Candidatus Neomarinimicrobiota bacterium]